MPSRKDLVDEALLRPGRMEVQVGIGLPDEIGRVQILSIHSYQMKKNSFLGVDVGLEELGDLVVSGSSSQVVVIGVMLLAVLEVASIDGYSLDLADLSKAMDEDNTKVKREVFLKGVDEVEPALGAGMNTLKMYWFFLEGVKQHLLQPSLSKVGFHS
ncbi:vesicle-fusing ATPase-like [Physcomitrium patens]|uniref:vesicle-fusing ATPase-like n=1 Tax=Physcomitrium patens TaxID=3218 RepID=UPI003CCDA2C7